MNKAPQAPDTGPRPIHPPPDILDGNCTIFVRHFISLEGQQDSKCRYYTGFSDNYAQGFIHSSMASTLEDLEYVRVKLKTHGDVILSSWSQKSVEKPKALLLEVDWVFSDIPSNVRKTDKRTSFTPYPSGHSNCAWGHWFDTGIFARDRMRLMSLLHARTEYSLDQWAMFDTYEGIGHLDPSTCQPRTLTRTELSCVAPNSAA